MKRGPEYVGSPQKRAYDLTVAYSGTPGAWAVKAMLARDMRARNTGLSATTTQTRVGKGERDVIIPKLTTTLPDGTSLGDWVGKYTHSGFDELVQLECVRLGTMSMDGPRPLLRTSPNAGGDLWTMERVLDEMDKKYRNPWRRVIRDSLPGILSSYAMHFHFEQPVRGDEANIRAELDLRDYYDASLSRSTGLLLAAARRIVLGEAVIQDRFRYGVDVPGIEDRMPELFVGLAADVD